MKQSMHVPQYSCRHPGCFAVASYFARGNEAKYGHVCCECYQMFSLKEQGKYIRGATEEQANELFSGGRIPDEPDERTHWLHRHLTPDLAVSTAEALRLHRAKIAH
jgi:hypothetical protein